MSISEDPYIEELRKLDLREAKTKLAEYALEYGIELKKTKSFDNMLSDFKEESEKIKSSPMPEDNEGISISDLIQASDESEGKSVFDDEAPADLKVLVGEIGSPVIEEVTEIQPTEETHVDEEESPEPEPIETPEETLIEPNVTSDDESPFQLDYDFYPRINLIGKAPGYMTLPWWIYEWIKDTPDWKQHPLDFPHPTAHDTLKTLIYYIERDGSVTVRETRNSSYITLN